MTTYRILWGHSGTQGKHWTTAREASRYAATEWGTVEASSPEAAVEIVRAESPEGTVGDWYADGETIHIVPAQPMIRWTELSMYVDGASQPIDVATLAGRVEEWDGDRPAVIHGVMLAAPGEDPDWDTPRVPVDWTGFRAAVEAAQPTH